MFLHVPQLEVQQAGLQSVAIGQLAIGPITVGELILSNTDFSMSAAQAVLQNMSVTVTLNIKVEWHVHVGLPDGIPDINIGDTYDLGSFDFSMPVGNVVLPGLSDIHVHIPSLTAQNMSVAASPLSVQLQNASVEQVHAQNVTLPAAGFSIAGLTLDSIQGHDVSVPAAHIDQASVGHLHGDALSIPSFRLSNLNLPSASIPQVSSSAPLNIPANLETLAPGFDAGLLRVAIHITPSVLSHVDHLEITGANASATAGQIVLHNVTLPYDVLNLTLSQIGINSVQVPAFNVS